MQQQQKKQNMMDKVRVFEDGGIRLLKKGQKGLVHAIFSRFGLVLVLLLLQFGALFSLLRWFGQLLPHYLGGTALVTAAMVVYLLNIDMDNSVRITWLVVIAVLPVLGVPLFWYTKADIGHNALKKRLMDLESQTRAQLPQPKQFEYARAVFVIFFFGVAFCAGDVHFIPLRRRFLGDVDGHFSFAGNQADFVSRHARSFCVWPWLRRAWKLCRNQSYAALRGTGFALPARQ